MTNSTLEQQQKVIDDYVQDRSETGPETYTANSTDEYDRTMKRQVIGAKFHQLMQANEDAVIKGLIWPSCRNEQYVPPTSKMEAVDEIQKWLWRQWMGDKQPQGFETKDLLFDRLDKDIG